MSDIMYFNDNIDKEKYKEFFDKHHGDFMQSYEWGQFNIKGRGQIPHYVGLEDEKHNLRCCSLLLERRGPLGYSYFYCPRGFLIDFNDYDLLKEFTDNLKVFLKKHKGIYLKVDPDIIYQEIDDDGNKVDNGFNNYKIYEDMLKLGYHHTGFNKYFDNNQPRYTFRIDLTKEQNELDKNIHKSVMRKIKKTSTYNMIFRESDNMDTFYNLIQNIASKDDFKSYSLDYYRNLYKILGSKGLIKVFELSIKPSELLADRNKEIKIVQEKLEKPGVRQNNVGNINNIYTRLKKEIELLEKYSNQDEVVICSQVCACTKDMMWTLYIGNDELGKEFYAVPRMYHEIIKYAKETNHKYLDLFGTTGDPKTQEHNLAGIHSFKKNFGGEYIELIGEFDLINKPFFYKILPIILKIYRKLKR